MYKLIKAGFVFLIVVNFCVKSTAEETVIHATKVSAPPVLDGKLTDICWQKAKPITKFLVMDSNIPAESKTIGYICFDDAHLYIGIKCLKPKGAKPVGMERPHDGTAYRDESVEIMIDPGHSKSDYYQLVVNAYGSTFDCSRLREGTQEDDSWDGDWTVKTHIDDEYWSAEMAIPFHNLGVSSGVGSTWGINLCRNSRNPSEQSSIAANGIYNQADKFAVLTDLNVDFAGYSFEIGPGVVRLVLTKDRPGATFIMPIKNSTGKIKKIKIENWTVGNDGKDKLTNADIASLGPGETTNLNLGPVAIELFLPDITDAYIVKSAPETKKIVVADPTTGLILAMSHIRKIFLCEAMKVKIQDPWRPDTKPEKSPAISGKVCTFLGKEQLNGGELIVNLISEETGRVLETKKYAKPSEETQIVFPTDNIPWGDYEVSAVFKDEWGKETITSKSSATVLPGGKCAIKVLNNFASELLNAKEQGLLGEKDMEFMNPRNGWVFFCAAGDAKITLNKETQPVVMSEVDEKTRESMRFLPAGKQVLHSDGELKQLIVRAVPELIYYTYGAQMPYIEPQGPYDWTFLSKDVLPNINVIVGTTKRSDELNAWTKQRKKWITNVPLPGCYTISGLTPADMVYQKLTADQGYQHPLTGGVMADEFTGEPDEQYMAWFHALCNIALNPEFKGRTFYPFVGASISGSDSTKTAKKIIIDMDWKLAFYRYLSEKPTEKEAWEHINDTIVKLAKSCNNDAYIGSVKNAIMTLGYMSAPPESQNGDPAVNFKTYMDMQFNVMANNPEFFGLYGIMEYSASRCDEENIRWAGRLFRHYCIEGKTERLSKDPYMLAHIKNPDFNDGDREWKITEAEPGAVGVKSIKGYKTLQGRYLTPLGDNFLVTKRSAKKANVFSQEINNLTPGRVYAMKMITADYGNISNEKSVNQKDNISIRLDNVEIFPGEKNNYQFTYYHEHNLGKFNAKNKAWMNYHCKVFRAKGDKSRITVSDWMSATEPGGPIGQEIMYNFIEIQPYLEK